MDLILNKPLQYQTLAAFLQENYADYDFFLLFPGVSDWDDLPENGRIFQYHSHEDMVGDYRFGVSIFITADDLLPFLENLASSLSNTFACGVLCDAVRVVIDRPATYDSLLFEQGKVYLVDDRYFEESGTVIKVVEMNYELPPLLPA